MPAKTHAILFSNVAETTYNTPVITASHSIQVVSIIADTKSEMSACILLAKINNTNSSVGFFYQRKTSIK